MIKVTTISIDIAKNVFHLCLFGRRGEVLGREKLSRVKLPAYLAKHQRCLVLMEACGGAHYWARECQGYGHEVKLIAPQFVKPYRKSQKNDHHDAEAIGIAGQQPTMRFVGIKRVEQQAMQQLHRVREQVKGQRTALSNQLRGMLYESGIVISRGIVALRRSLPEILEDGSNELTPIQRELLASSYDRLVSLDAELKRLTQWIEQQAAKDERARRLVKELDGIGPLSATALLAAIADPGQFSGGRQVSAWLGLVPRQWSTGGRTVLGSITKAGHRQLRALLIHGARSVISHLGDKSDDQSQWLRRLVSRAGVNKAAVALANKNARMAWAVLMKAA